ncbi:MAG: methylamine utilization protein [Burkholderiales bacterium]|nr:methylamine utilization protein [Burkholderiales bacterium]
MRRLGLILLCLLALPARAGTLVVDVLQGSGRPLADAVVFLESPQARRQVRPLTKAEMGQAGKQFVPQVLVVTTGTEVDFPNRDTVRHHVYSFSPVKKFELKLYIGTPTQPVLFDQPGIAVLGCNIHDQMVGWIVIVDTPYFGRTAEQGQLVLDKLPPGNYRLRSWHPGLPVGAPALDQAVTVPAEGRLAVTVRMPGVAP